MIDLFILQQIAPQTAVNQLSVLVTPLNQTLVEFDIDTRLRQSHFLAQVAHESDRFKALEEYSSGSAYEGRADLGNIKPGDGVRFKGRGLIQLTGRANYERCGKALRVDLITYPKRLGEPNLACRSAGWYWSSNQLNKFADKDDIEKITRVINGGIHGLENRKQLLEAAKIVLRL